MRNVLPISAKPSTAAFLPTAKARVKATKWLGASASIAILVSLMLPARAQTSLLTNGSFENGLAGWTVQNRPPGGKYDPNDMQAAQGQFYAASYADSDANTAGTQFTAPISQLVSTPNTSALTNQGNNFAVSDMNATGTHTLSQSFVAPVTGAVTISWSMFVYNWYGDTGAVATEGLDHTTGNPNQHGRVDLLTSSAATADPFTTTNITSSLFGPGVDIEASQGVDPLWRNYSRTVSGLTAGQSYTLRYAVTDNQFVLNMAVDRVMVAEVPEPGTASLLIVSGLLCGFVVLFVLRRRCPVISSPKGN